MTHLLIPLFVGASILGPDDPKTKAAAEYDGSAGHLAVATPALEDVEINLDGRLDEAAWSQAALLYGFTQFRPVEGAPASQRTEVLVFVDADAIYFGFKAYDDDPSRIRATLSDRDSFTFTDDYVRVTLDTFDDSRRAYIFSVNPLGVQHDGIWNESGGSAGRRGGFGPPIDDNPDFLWDSGAHITEWGYEAEIRIPFKSLRFPDSDEQSWGIQAVRNVQRLGFSSSWAPLTNDVSNRLAQAGKLRGLRNLDMGLFMELNPVLTGTRFGEYDDQGGSFRRGDPKADFGLNATYGITSNLTLDGTYNPDFSQVEADAGQISVNERFALFFPEKRPFFLEGTEIFGMPRQLVYTRSIANPIGGAKLTGKVGSLNVGYLGAVDESFDAGDPNTVVNLVRLRQDLGASSTLGLVYTDRSIDAADFNRVTGADARFQFGGRYTLTMLGSKSFTHNSGLEAREAGELLYGKFERAGRALSFNAEFEDTSPEFRAASGFFNRIGDTQLLGRVSYNWFAAQGGLLQSVNPSVDLKGFWDHDAFWAGGDLEEAQAQLSWRFQFRDNITFWGNYSRTMFSFAPESYEGLFVEQGAGAYQPFRPDQDLFGGLNGLTLSFFVNKWQRVRGNVFFTINETPIFDRSLGVAVEPATSYSGNMMLNLFLTRSLTAEVGVNQRRLVRKRDGVEHSSATIPRVRAQYQFSRALFVRGIFEYSSQESAALADPLTGLPLARCDAASCSLRTGSDGHDFHIEGLVSYEPSPGTVFFIGYSRQMEDSGAFDFRDVRATADGLFVKLSYRFRM
jgi:hypothetical protein